MEPIERLYPTRKMRNLGTYRANKSGDVVRGRGAGRRNGVFAVGLGSAGYQGDGSGKSDANQVGIRCNPRDGKRNSLVDRVLYPLQCACGRHWRDRVNVTDERAGAAIEHDVLDAGRFEKCESECVLV